jgi:hypothetical protein
MENNVSEPSSWHKNNYSGYPHVQHDLNNVERFGFATVPSELSQADL